MASELILDRTNTDIDSLVAGWKKGETYRVSGAILYTDDDAKLAKFKVVEVTDETVAEEPEGEFPAEKPKMGKPSIVISK